MVLSYCCVRNPLTFWLKTMGPSVEVPEKTHYDPKTTTGVQVVEAVVHLHERVMQDPKVCLNVLHPLSMLMHELVEAVLCGMVGRHPLFQSLEQWVGLVELERQLELAKVKEKADVLDVQGSLSS